MVKARTTNPDELKSVPLCNNTVHDNLPRACVYLREDDIANLVVIESPPPHMFQMNKLSLRGEVLCANLILPRHKRFAFSPYLYVSWSAIPRLSMTATLHLSKKQDHASNQPLHFLEARSAGE